MKPGNPASPQQSPAKRRVWSTTSPWATFMYLGAMLLLTIVLTRGPSSKPEATPRPLSDQSQLRQIQGEKRLTGADGYLDREAVKLTEAILKLIQADPALSPNAKRAVIVTSEDAITIRGHVRSESEKRTIGMYARNETTKRVNNELIIQ